MRIIADLAGLQVDLDAVDLVEIGAGDADKAGIIRIVDRMNGAVLVDAGLAWREPVLLDRLELGVLGVGPIVLALPFDHVGILLGLAVDRPRGAVVVRRRNARLAHDVAEHLEAELGVFVKDLDAGRLDRRRNMSR